MICCYDSQLPKCEILHFTEIFLVKSTVLCKMWLSAVVVAEQEVSSNFLTAVGHFPTTRGSKHNRKFCDSLSLPTHDIVYDLLNRLCFHYDKHYKQWFSSRITKVSFVLQQRDSQVWFVDCVSLHSCFPAFRLLPTCFCSHLCVFICTSNSIWLHARERNV